MATYFTKKGYDEFLNRIDALDKNLRKLAGSTAEEVDTSGLNVEGHTAVPGLEMRIQSLSNMRQRMVEIRNDAEIIEYPAKSDTVALGTEVDVTVDGADKRYKIVGYGEGNPRELKIPYNSPLAQGIMGYKKGDEFVEKVNGNSKYIVVNDIRPITD